MHITKQLLLNLSILLVLLFFFQIWFDRRVKQSISKWSLLVFYLLSVILSMLLSIQLGQVARYDLRHIPFIIGSLYNGPWISIILFFFTILIRAIFGVNEGLVTFIIIFSLQALVIACLHKWFVIQSVKKKIFISIVVSIVSSCLFILGKYSFLTTELCVSYIVISALGTGMVSYSIETWKKNIYLRHQVLKAEKIEAISNMAAAISHEVRNPITVTRGFLQFLREDDFKEEKRKEFIEIAIKELDRAEGIIQDYLAFSRPSLVHVELLEPKDEIKQVMAILQPLANMNSVDFSLNLLTDVKILGDKSQFHQCLLNLLKNCIEAMSNGGILSVELKDIDDVLQIHVSDTGVGMTEEQLYHLGEPYYTTKGQKGTGLGMMVVFSIIRAMKGSIKVKSTINIGTEFCITFPIYKEKRMG